MINFKDNPVEWALLVYELTDASEHLKSLLDELETHGGSDEEDYKIQLGHVYAHLNRAWNCRNRKGEGTEDERDRESMFPSDLDPVG